LTNISSYISVVYFITAFIPGAVAIYVWERRSKPGAFYFALFIIVAAEWSLMCAFEYMVAEIPLKIFFDNLSYFGAVLAAPMWLFFALEYGGQGSLLTAGICWHSWRCPRS